MTSYRYIGYGVTNSNGVAHLDHDPQGNPINGYTGTGAGEVDVIASTDNPITSSSIVSETLPVLDTIIYDNGFENDYNDNCWVTETDVEVIHGADGTTVENKASGTKYRYANDGTVGNYDFSTPVRIEFDFELLTPSANCQIQMFDAENNYFSSWITTTGKYVIDVNENEVTWTINGTARTGKTVTLGNFFFRFMMQSGNKFKYSNFKIYPI